MLPTMISQPMRASGSPRFARPASDAQNATRIRPDVAAEVDEHRELGADLGDRGERGAGVVPAEQLAHDPQVGAGGDRQELGEALHDPQDDGFEPAHAGSADAGNGAADGGQRTGWERAHEGAL